MAPSRVTGCACQVRLVVVWEPLLRISLQMGGVDPCANHARSYERFLRTVSRHDLEGMLVSASHSSQLDGPLTCFSRLTANLLHEPSTLFDVLVMKDVQLIRTWHPLVLATLSQRLPGRS